MKPVTKLVINPLVLLFLGAFLAASLGVFFGLMVAGLALELGGVLITFYSINSTRKYLGGENLIDLFMTKVREVESVIEEIKEGKELKTKITNGAFDQKKTVITFRKIVLHSVEKTTLLSLREDVKKLSENQEVIAKVIKEDSERIESALAKLRSSTKTSTEDIKNTFTEIHVKGTEYSFIGITWILIGAVLGAAA